MTELLSEADCLDMGYGAFNRNDYPLANDYFDQALARNPKSAEALNYKGLVALQLGAFEEAISWWHQSIQAKENAKALSNLGFYFSNNQRTQEAKPYLKRAYEIAPHEKNCAIQWAYIEALEKNFEVAESILEELLAAEAEGYPELINESVYVMLSQVKSEQKDQEGAKAVIDLLLQKRPDSVTAIHQKARLCQILEQYTEANDLYQQLLKVVPDHTDVIKEYAGFLINHYDLKEAIAFLEEKSGQIGQDWELFTQLGLAHEKSGDLKQALKAFGQASELNPNYPNLKVKVAQLQKNILEG